MAWYLVKHKDSFIWLYMMTQKKEYWNASETYDWLYDWRDYYIWKGMEWV